MHLLPRKLLAEETGFSRAALGLSHAGHPGGDRQRISAGWPDGHEVAARYAPAARVERAAQDAGLPGTIRSASMCDALPGHGDNADGPRSGPDDAPAQNRITECRKRPAETRRASRAYSPALTRLSHVSRRTGGANVPRKRAILGKLPQRKNASHGQPLGWGGRIRTSAWRNQNPLPYRLATPQSHHAHQ